MIIEFQIIDYFERTKKTFFKIAGRNDVYDIQIKIEDGMPLYFSESCDCEFGSFYGQTKENQKNGKICSHLRECLSFLEREGWIENQKEEKIITTTKINGIK